MDEEDGESDSRSIHEKSKEAVLMARKPFNIASADSMGIKPMRVDPGRPGDPDDPKPIRPIIDDPEIPPQDSPEEEKPTPEEEGQSIADEIGFDGTDSEGSILDNYSFLGFVALAAIGITLIG